MYTVPSWVVAYYTLITEIAKKYYEQRGLKEYYWEKVGSTYYWRREVVIEEPLLYQHTVYTIRELSAEEIEFAELERRVQNKAIDALYKYRIRG